ncbi:putative metalloprotease CJM1_0395 family protein [Chitinilyticum piscinae]|uniref:SprA-related family protein n=1 Tax=Chitinilyticum piscinae TaxID=2866724 RepID=A0A8J7K126_9NEIS|nr:putative metalloprotease CJM1_0395 family protein [Chitinilyticum piscinae]MBE9608606.1 hypothetical protein [Chitinilyticum piscinae]
MSPNVGSAMTALIDRVSQLVRRSDTAPGALLPGTARSTVASDARGNAWTPRGSDGKPLSNEQQAEVADLQQTDRRVRSHEQMHINAAQGIQVSGPHFDLQDGPDGRRYAVAGEVEIDTSPGRDHHETLWKARAIQVAALAPPDPSAQDRAVAAQAARMEEQASSALAEQQARQARVSRHYRSSSAPTLLSTYA